jgi:anti-sigma factor RsiW
MKPCFSKRKLIALLTLGELDARRAEDLRAHLETCAGCRCYLADISAVGRRLAAAQTAPGIEASESFHQRLVGQLRAEQTESIWGMLATWKSATRLNWRVALPAIGVAMLVIVMLSIPARQPVVSPPARISRPVVASSASREDLSPTVANYQRAASRSLDELDELLTRQARRIPSHTPIYTASIFPLAHAPD